MANADSGALVTSARAACENIRGFANELRKNPKLGAIISYSRAWYACRDDDGTWAIAPSKFIGYERAGATDYLQTHRERDGRLTEQALRHWFVPITSDDALYADLLDLLRGVFSRNGKTPNKLVRISVLKSEAGSLRKVHTKEPGEERPISRITVDPLICGGRPCIRGMRIRVSDILDMLASGAGREEILADYRYLEDADIDAALEYASRSVDHRVIRAA
jgi:uncharacterized protein (DUF433 family)